MKRFFTVFFLLFFLSHCGKGVKEKVLSLGGNFKIYVTAENGIEFYGNGKRLLVLKSVEVAQREVKSFFFAGYTKFEENFKWENSSDSYSVEGEKILTYNGVTIAPAIAGGKILKIHFDSNKGNSLILHFACDKNDHFLGFGAQTYRVDQRGEVVPIWVEEEGIHKMLETDTNPLWFLVGSRHNSYYPLPYFYNPKGYSFLVDTPYYSRFDLCFSREDQWSVLIASKCADIYLFTPSSSRESVKLYTDLTGKPIEPEKWYFSPWNDAVGGEEKVMEVANILRSNRIPSSVIWTEDWGGGGLEEGESYRFVYNWDVGYDLYPDFETMVSELHHNGFHFLVYFNSFLDSKSRIWNSIPPDFMIKAKDGEPYMMIIPTLNWGSLLDLTDDEAWQWAEEKMKQAIDLGVDGWMADYGEWLPYDSVVEKGTGREYHNLYPLLWHSLNREVMEKFALPHHFVYFTRSGYIGDQALTPVYWPGDQSTDFSIDDGLPTAVAVAINVGWSGTVMYGSDIAGYMSIGNPPSDKELFMRWLEFGAFSPVMRTHHGYLAFKNWNFHKDEYTLRWYKFYAVWHQRLFPYLYSEALTAGSQGIPLIRHLLMEFQDPAVINIDSEYMLGPYLLVAPVLRRGARSRVVYFPEGRWFSLWDGSMIASHGQWLKVPAPLEQIPVFVREGGIIELIASDIDTIQAPPSASGEVVTLAQRDNWREIRFYPGVRSEWKDYEGNIFENNIVKKLGETFALNGKKIGSCDQSPPPCFIRSLSGIEVKVNSGDNIKISDDNGNFAKIAPTKTRWWDIFIFEE